MQDKACKHFGTVLGPDANKTSREPFTRRYETAAERFLPISGRAARREAHSGGLRIEIKTDITKKARREWSGYLYLHQTNLQLKREYHALDLSGWRSRLHRGKGLEDGVLMHRSRWHEPRVSALKV